MVKFKSVSIAFCMVVMFVYQQGVENSPVVLQDLERIKPKIHENICFNPELQDEGGILTIYITTIFIQRVNSF